MKLTVEWFREAGFEPNGSGWQLKLYEGTVVVIPCAVAQGAWSAFLLGTRSNQTHVVRTVRELLFMLAGGFHDTGREALRGELWNLLKPETDK